MANALKHEILEYWPLLDSDEQKSILGVVKSFLKLKNNTKRISTAQYTQELDDAIARIENGEFTTHDDVIKESETW